jgi:DNA-binding response OmpR family regulator
MENPTETRLLVIDDDRKLCGLIAEYLRPFGFRASAAHSGPEGLALLGSGEFDVVLLDVMLPGLDGFEVLRRIRAVSAVPVLMLTALGDETDRVLGLESGADDYLPKTFSSRELLARLRAVLRRAALRPAEPANVADVEWRCGDLYLNESRHLATQGDRPLDLTPVEFSLLAALLRARGRVCTRERLMEEIREREFEAFDRSIDVHVSALRRKLGDDARDPRIIRTVRAVGYQLAAAPHPAAEVRK